MVQKKSPNVNVVVANFPDNLEKIFLSETYTSKIAENQSQKWLVFLPKEIKPGTFQWKSTRNVQFHTFSLRFPPNVGMQISLDRGEHSPEGQQFTVYFWESKIKEMTTECIKTLQSHPKYLSIPVNAKIEPANDYLERHFYIRFAGHIKGLFTVYKVSYSNILNYFQIQIFLLYFS